MDRPLVAGAGLTGGLAILAWTQLGRPAIAPCGMVAGLIVGLATPETETGFIRGAKAGALGATGFVGTIVVVGAVRYRTIGLGFVIDWALFTAFSMGIIVLPLFAMEGAFAGPVTTVIARSMRKGPWRSRRW
mgnify:CR=1 FL=1